MSRAMKNPSDRLLVVVDMQNDFIDGALGSPEAQAIVDKVCRKIESWDGMVWYTMDTHDEVSPEGVDYFDTAEGKDVPVLHCIRDTEGWSLHPMVGEAILKHRGSFENEQSACLKFNKSSYGSPELAATIKAMDSIRHFTHVEFVGLCTDVCVISNVFELRNHAPEIPVYVDASCCAGVTPERHQHALAAMQAVGAKVIGNEID